MQRFTQRCADQLKVVCRVFVLIFFVWNAGARKNHNDHETQLLFVVTIVQYPPNE